MEADFPAAHSMDTEWYAVDGKGHVAVFISGENGPVPVGQFQKGDLPELLRRLRGGGTEAEREDDGWEELELEAAERGMFVYMYPEELSILEPYARTGTPDGPLHVDQLPPDLRKQFKETTLNRVDFARDENVQPVEHLGCEFWSDEVAGYLAGDKRTVRPVPGKEEQFREISEEVRQWEPEQSKEWRFEGLEDEAKQTQRRRKRKDSRNGS
jgi:hypothetical protein